MKILHFLKKFFKKRKKEEILIEPEFYEIKDNVEILTEPLKIEKNDNSNLNENISLDK